MAKHALWTTTATLALLTAGIVASPSALAQKGTILHPQTAWAVTNVNDGSADPYCAIARRFRRNVILTFAENRDGMISVAIDFRDSSFDMNNKYDVILDPGAGEVRSYTLKPISAKAFVVRLGGDPNFFEALSRTGYMRVEVGGQSYNLNLSDVDKGLDTLNNCLGNNRPAPAQTPAKPEPLREAQHMDSRIGSLEAENDKLRVELAQKQDAAAAKQPRYVMPGGAAGEVKPLQAVPPREGQLAVLVNRLEVLETKNIALQRELRQQEELISENHSGELARLSEENLRLQEVLSQNISGQKMADGMQARMNLLQMENGQLSDKAEQLDKLRVEVTLLAEENVNLHAEMQTLDKLKNKLRLLRLEKDSASAESVERVTELTHSMQELRSVNERLQEDLGAQKIAVETTSDKLADALAQKSALQAEMEKKAQQEMELIKLQKDLHVLNGKKAALDGEIQALTENNEELSVAQGRMTLLQADNQQYQEEMKRLEAAKTALDSKLKENKMLAAALDEDKNSLQAMIVEAETKNAKLVADLRAQLKTSQSNEAVQAEHIKALRAENDDLLAELSEATIDQETLTKMQGDLTALRAEHAALQTVQKEQLNALESLRASHDKIEDENHKLIERLSAAKSDYDALLAEKTALQDNLTAANDALSDAREDLAAATSGRSEYELVSKALKDEKDDLAGQLDQLKDKNVALTGQLAQAKNAHEVMESASAALKDEKEAMAKRLGEVQKTQEALAQTTQLLTEENKGLAQQLTKAQENAGQVANTSASFKAGKDELAAKLAKVNEKLQTIEVSNAALDNEKKSLANQLTQASTAQKDLKGALDKLRQENDDLSDALVAAKSDNKDIAALQDELASWQQRNKTLTAALDEQRVAYKDLEKIVTPLRKESAALKQELMRLNASLQKLQTQMDQREASVPAAATKRVQVAEARQSAAPAAPSSAPAPVKATAPIPTPVEDAPVKQTAAKTAPAKPAERVVKQESVDEETGIIVKNRLVQNTNNRTAPPAFHNEAQSLERNMVRTIKETEDGFVQSGARPMINDAPEIAEATPQTADAVADKTQKTADVKNEPQRQESEFLMGSSFEGGNGQIETATSDTQKEPEPTSASIESEALAPTPQMQARSSTAPAVIPSEQTASPDDTPPRIYVPAVRIENILAQAGIRTGAAPQQIKGFSGPQVVSYQWQGASGLFGSAQQKPLQTAAQFDNFVQDYLGTTEGRCQGDFAAIPSASKMQGMDRIESYEIACVGAGVNSSASLLFFSQGGTFTALAHEAPTDNMQTAMDVRDRIMQSVSGS